MNLILILCAITAAEPPAPSVSTWRPFDHPAEVRRASTAFTQPRRALSITSEVTARVERVACDEGDELAIGSVEEDGVVIELDRRLAEAELEVERAAHRVARAELASIATTESRATRALEYWRRQAARIRDLAESGRATESERDDVEYSLDVAQVEFEDVARRRASMEANVELATARIGRAEEQLRRFSIRAPSGWRVERRSVEPGQLARPGVELLYLVDLSRVRVSYLLDAEELAALRGRTSLTVRPPGADEPIPCRVHTISSEHDPSTLKRRVELEIEADVLRRVIGECSGGLEVELELNVPDRSGGVLVPVSFISRRYEQSFVRCSDGRDLPVTVLRDLGDRALLLLPVGTAADTTLVLP